MAGSSSSVSLVVHAAALVVIYSLYSLLQEKIMKTTYGTLNASGCLQATARRSLTLWFHLFTAGPADEHFTSASLLVLSNRLFSLCAGVGFSLLLPKSGEQLSPSQRLRPSWPMYSYAMVAAANFASTYCQYDALRFVGFTTQALAKCAKMVPVLLIGSLFYKKSYKTKEYVAGAVVLLGCFVYLVSRPSGSSAISSKHHQIAQSADPSHLSALLGGALLCAYLFFDGLTSTTQEHYFGKTKKDIAPLTPGGPVLDQMVFVNLCATAISAFICVANAGTTLPSFKLAMQSQQLWMDITLLSATATFGLVILYDTIFKHGALTVATTMTLRQFFSILLNAGIFGNFALIGFGGWLGVGFVAAGVWIKMDRRFDVPKPVPTSPLSSIGSSGTSSKDVLEKHALLAGEGGKEVDDITAPLSLKSQIQGGAGEKPLYATPEQDGDGKPSPRRLFAQYGVPLCLPLVFALVASVFI